MNNEAFHKLKRCNYPVDPTGPVNFQIVDWFCQDEICESLGNEDDEEILPEYDQRNYVIRAFGVTEAGNSVCSTIYGFQPYFFVELPDNWDKYRVMQMVNNIRNRKYKLKTKQTTQQFSYEFSLVKYEIVRKKKLYGFTNGRKFNFVKLYFKNYNAMRSCAYIFDHEIMGKKLNIYESNIDPMLRFMHTRNILAAGWVTIENYEKNNLAKTQIDIKTSWDKISPLNKDDIAPIRQASFDIETYSVNGDMPLPETEGNVVFQIATTFQDYGSTDVCLKHIMTLKKSPPIEGAIVECYETEHDLLLAWANLINEMDPDLITGYNIFGFDFRYLVVRAEIAGCLGKFSELGRLKGVRSKMVEKVMESKAYGRSEWYIVPTIGRFQIDLLPYIRREKKYDSYKLDDVAEIILGENKHDVTPQQIFDYYASGDPEKIKTIAEYCIQDTLLPQRIINKMSILPNLIEMSKVTMVPLEYLIVRGQQIKVFSQISKRAMDDGYLCPVFKRKFGPNDDDEEEEDEYEGATVLSAQKGAYIDETDQEAGLDFASLYPTIMIDHNLCYTTIVLDDRYKNIPGVRYKEYDIDGNKYTYALSYQGVLPGILIDLLNSRRYVKKLMANETDPFKKSVLDGRQLALKVSCNSVYGFTGISMDKGIMGCKPIAATTTRIGRGMIEDSKNYAENIENFLDIPKYAASVKYGDTDSIFTKFDTTHLCSIRDRIRWAMILGDIVSQRITIFLRKQTDFLPEDKKWTELEYEKIYIMWILFSKKRYMGWMFEDDPIKPEKFDKKGIVLTRRDNAPIVKNIFGGCSKILCDYKNGYTKEQKVKKAADFAIDIIDQ